jgi:hypothetical protein
MPFAVKLRALALNARSLLRNASEDWSHSARDTAITPIAAPRNGPTLLPVKLGALPSAQQEESFARQCTLQAVFDWYQGFSDGEESSLPLSNGGSADDPVDQPVPGFPQFSRQVIDTEQDTVRVRFFYSGGREAGILLLRREANRCVIEVPDGPLYVVSRAQGLADLIRELEDIPTAGRSAGSRVETLR